MCILLCLLSSVHVLWLHRVKMATGKLQLFVFFPSMPKSQDSVWSVWMKSQFVALNVLFRASKRCNNGLGDFKNAQGIFLYAFSDFYVQVIGCACRNIQKYRHRPGLIPDSIALICCVLVTSFSHFHSNGVSSTNEACDLPTRLFCSRPPHLPLCHFSRVCVQDGNC